MEAGTTRTIKLTVAYDGTGLVGWQRQAEGVSVQGVLEDALSRFDGRPVAVIGAGRTDAGAHAAGQVASARLESRVDAVTLRRALNAMIPPQVCVLAVEEAPPSFHARFAAHSKTYRYVVAAGGLVGPFLSRYVWPVEHPLDVTAMAEAAGRLVGRHDFAAFQGTGSGVGSTVRTVFSSAVRTAAATDLMVDVVPGFWPAVAGSATLVVCEITGDGFLRHMVRTIAGTLVEIGRGRRERSSMIGLIEQGDRRRAGPTAPACGLWLVSVQYPQEASGAAGRAPRPKACGSPSGAGNMTACPPKNTDGP